MDTAEKIDEFFRGSGQEVYIEVEGTPDTIEKFIEKYNREFDREIDMYNEGIRVLQDGANKWGVELRMYFNDDSGIPSDVNVTRNRVYRSEYFYRINDIKLIKEMFDLGYKIGLN